ncbi:hypothetical protein STIAU_2984 [Stigmatella aurantiaca DW4/3-1]|uniref:Uncharacterized protein n=1 Tax=Stigmatella aurantiaca (strain DW4/3-1) TaxID=378806 RepID=Q09D80_STIAD|nr:hypothetical protein STIAU_2984 [Stigmatella aurantiaca DW4/3-1]
MNLGVGLGHQNIAIGRDIEVARVDQARGEALHREAFGQRALVFGPAQHLAELAHRVRGVRCRELHRPRPSLHLIRRPGGPLGAPQHPAPQQPRDSQSTHSVHGSGAFSCACACATASGVLSGWRWCWAWGSPRCPARTRDSIQFLERLIRQRAFSGGEVFPQVRDRRGAGDQKDVGRAAKQPGKRDLHGGGTETRRDSGQGGRLQGGESAEWEERHVGDAVARKAVDQGIVGPMRQIVLVLHADDGGDPASLRDLRGGDVAQADVAHQPLLLEPGQHREWRLDGALCGSMSAEHEAQVHHVEGLQAQVAQVVVDRLSQLLGGEGREPGAILAPPGADLGDDDEIAGIGRERFADQPVRDVRAVVVAGVDVVDPARDRLAQHGQRRAVILGRAEHAGPRELHGAIAEPLHGAASEGECAGQVNLGHVFSFETTQIGAARARDNGVQSARAVRNGEQ